MLAPDTQLSWRKRPRLYRWLTTMSFDPERFEVSDRRRECSQVLKNQCQPSWNYCFKQFVSNGQAARCTPDSLSGLEPTELAQASRLCLQPYCSGASGHWRQFIGQEANKPISMNRMSLKTVLTLTLKPCTPITITQINLLTNNYVQSKFRKTISGATSKKWNRYSRQIS